MEHTFASLGVPSAHFTSLEGLPLSESPPLLRSACYALCDTFISFALHEDWRGTWALDTPQEIRTLSQLREAGVEYMLGVYETWDHYSLAGELWRVQQDSATVATELFDVLVPYARRCGLSDDAVDTLSLELENWWAGLTPH